MASASGSGSSSVFRTTSGYPQSRQPSYMTQASSSSSVLGDSFTAQMRDRQARGKDPYHSGDGSEGSDLSDREMRPTSRMRISTSRLEREDFSRMERREKAELYLGSTELLMMYAEATGDSIAGARLHFTRMLCGYDDDDDDDKYAPNHRSTRNTSSHQQHTGPPSRENEKRRVGPGPRG